MGKNASGHANGRVHDLGYGNQTMPNLLKQCLLLSLSMTIFGLWSIHLGQDFSWDLRNYHFYNPYAFLHHRLDIDIAPAMMQTYFNPFLDLINYFFITTQQPIVAGFLLGAISGITAFFIYQTTLLLLKNRLLAFMATLIGMTGYASVIQLGATTNETKTACLLIIAIYSLLRSLQSKEKTFYWVILSGLLTGLAVGFKLTAVTYGIGMVIAYIFTQRPSLGLTFIIAIMLEFLLSNGYWMWVLYQHFHNPLFPLYNNIFHSPYGNSGNYKDMRFYPTDWQHFVFLPFYFLKSNTLVTEFSMRDPRLAVTFVLILLFFCTVLLNKLRKKKNVFPEALPFLLTIFMISYLAWLIEFTIYRYLVFLEILSGILIVFFIHYFFKQRRFLQLSVLVLFTIAIQLDTHYTPWSRTHFKENYFTAGTIQPLPPHSLLLLLGKDYPFGYMVPFLASHSRVFSIDNYFMYPTNKNKLQENANQLILHFKGPIYSLALAKTNDIDSNVLAYYHLRQDKSQCIMITSLSPEANPMLLCPLVI